jgi:hypothetical protein
MRIALDTNIPAYAEGIGDRVKQDLSLSLIRRHPGDSFGAGWLPSPPMLPPPTPYFRQYSPKHPREWLLGKSGGKAQDNQCRYTSA